MAIEEIRKGIPESEISVREDGQGGAYVIAESAPIGDRFQQPTTWCGFRITFQYPYADCYPHFVDGTLRLRSGAAPSAAGIQPGHVFEGRPALQLSRRSKRLNPQTDTAMMKLAKVLLWLGSQR